jgi:hypothetical protein
MALLNNRHDVLISPTVLSVDPLSLWVQAEEQFAANRYSGADDALPVLSGSASSRVGLVAPHAVNVLVNGDVKLADRFTGGLCLAVASATNVSHVVRSRTSDEPRTWTLRTDEFAKAVGRLIGQSQIILDLHGMRDDHGVDVCLGRGPSPHEGHDALVDICKAGFSGFDVRVDEPFSGRPSHTVMSLLHSVGAVGLQLEIAARWRDPLARPNDALAFFTAFSQVVSVLRTD